MRYHYYIPITIVILILLLSQPVSAQHWEYGGWLGISNYFGDLNTQASFEYIGPATGMFVRYNIGDTRHNREGTRFAYKVGLNYARVAFKDASSNKIFQQARNLSFKSNIYELSNQMEFNFFKYDREKDQFAFTPYLLVGVSVFFYQSKAELNGVDYSLASYRTEGRSYTPVSVAIPLGGGFKYSFNPFWAIGLEGGYRKSFTDNIDDVSTVYPGNLSDPVANSLSDRSSEVIDPPIGQEGKQRGIAGTKDDYLFIGITISYSPIKVRCPKPSKIP